MESNVTIGLGKDPKQSIIDYSPSLFKTTVEVLSSLCHSSAINRWSLESSPPHPTPSFPATLQNSTPAIAQTKQPSTITTQPLPSSIPAVSSQASVTATTLTPYLLRALPLSTVYPPNTSSNKKEHDKLGIIVACVFAGIIACVAVAVLIVKWWWARKRGHPFIFGSEKSRTPDLIERSLYEGESSTVLSFQRNTTNRPSITTRTATVETPVAELGTTSNGSALMKGPSNIASTGRRVHFKEQQTEGHSSKTPYPRISITSPNGGDRRRSNPLSTRDPEQSNNTDPRLIRFLKNIREEILRDMGG
ncbi:hypothetical protein BU17DRAFT_70606 [Hysterangium stoloniferum]|nr:hypothetical protein BU17DRAFT_70606 [Hysterangium stoloniferum]